MEHVRNSEPKEKEIHPQNIVAEIITIQQQVAAMGGNDSEMSDFKNILEDLQKGNLTQESALELARNIRDQKGSDYK